MKTTGAVVILLALIVGGLVLFRYGVALFTEAPDMTPVFEEIKTFLPNDEAAAPTVPPPTGEFTTLPTTGTTESAGTPVGQIPANIATLLERLGVAPEDLPTTISPELERCVRDALGSERVDAILAGDTPGVIEGIKALRCL